MEEIVHPFRHHLREGVVVDAFVWRVARGCIEVWDLDSLSRRFEMFYLELKGFEDVRPSQFEVKVEKRMIEM